MDLNQIRNSTFISKWKNELIRTTEGNVITKSQFWKLRKPTGKGIFVEKYAKKKICFTYKRLANPKVSYAIFYNENNFYEVPKIIYENYFKEIPEKFNQLNEVD